MTKREAKIIAITKVLDILDNLIGWTDYNLSDLSEVHKVDQELSNVHNGLLKRLDKLIKNENNQE